jgi:succinyl-diaminopimelate desuccinylase
VIDVDAEGVVAFTQALVRTPSVNDPTHGRSEQVAAGLVAEKMREFGWRPVLSGPALGRPNVVAVVEGGGGDGPTLLFEGHTDVVTEGAHDTWTVDPFGAEISDGRLYGRGAADMKSGVAAMLYAVRALQVAGPFPGRIKIAALADEEGLMIGVHDFIDTGEADGVDAAIVGEPEGGEICAVSKGAIRIRADFHGRMAHGAMPQHGRSPIAAAVAFLGALAGLERGLQERHGDHPHLGITHVTPTVLRAGDLDQINVIPADATVAVDVRTVPGVDHAEVIAAVTAAARGADHQVDAVVSVLVDRPPVDTPADHPVIAALAAAHRRVTGEEPAYGGVPGTTDGTILTARAGVPTVVYGPGGKWIAHQADEYVEVAEIVRCTRVYAEAARLFLTGGDG